MRKVSLNSPFVGVTGFLLFGFATSIALFIAGEAANASPWAIAISVLLTSGTCSICALRSMPAEDKAEDNIKYNSWQYVTGMALNAQDGVEGIVGLYHSVQNQGIAVIAYTKAFRGQIVILRPDTVSLVPSTFPDEITEGMKAYREQYYQMS